MNLRLIAILLLLQFVSFQVWSGGIIGQVLNVNSLVEHWEVHYSEDSEITVAEFISEHFLPFAGHEQEHNHRELPFHQLGSNFSICTIFLIIDETCYIKLLELFKVPINSFFNGFDVYHPPC